METAALVVPVTALEFIQDDYLLSGEGPVLTVYRLQPRPKNCFSLRVLQHQRIHGIRPRIFKTCEQGTCGPSPFFYDLAVFGGKAVRLVRLHLSEPFHLENISPVMELHDWILDVRWMSGDPLLCVALAHNSALLLDTASGSTLYRRSCSEGCLLYSALLLAHETWSDTVLIGGTVFNQLVIWKPGNLAQNSDSKADVERRLLGHSGVIFAISYLQNEGVIASASDDRSVRIWQVGTLGGNGGLCGSQNPVCLHVLYGHQARVFSVKLSYGKVFSAGEDGACLMWENGKVTQTLKGHRAGGVRALAISAEESYKNETWIATGGADGGVRIWKLGMRRDKEECNEEKLVDLKFPKDKVNSCEMKTQVAKRKEKVLKTENATGKHKTDHSKPEKAEVTPQMDNLKPDLEYVTNKMAEVTMDKLNQTFERRQNTDDQSDLKMQGNQKDQSFVEEKQSKDNMDIQEAQKSKSEQEKKEMAKNRHMGEQVTVEKGLNINKEEFEVAEEANIEKHEATDDTSQLKDIIMAKQKPQKSKTDLDIASVGVPKVICTLDAENSTWSDCSFVVCTDKGVVFHYSNEKWRLIWQGPPEFQSYCVMEVVSLKLKGVIVHLCAVGNISGSVQVFPTANPKSGIRLEAGSGKIHSLIWQKGSGIDEGVWLLASGNNGLVYRWCIGVKERESLELEVKEMSTFVLPVCAKRWLTAAVRVEVGKEVVWVCGDRRGSLLLYRESDASKELTLKLNHDTKKDKDKMQSRGVDRVELLAENVANEVMPKVNQEMVKSNKECQEIAQECKASMLIPKLNPAISQENDKMQSKEDERAAESEANEQVPKVNLGIDDPVTASEEETEANKLTPKLNSVTGQENKTILDNWEKPLVEEKDETIYENKIKSIEERGEILGVSKDKLMLKLTPASILFGVHGKQGVTSVFEYSGLFYSTGRDGCVRIFKVCSKTSEKLQNDAKVNEKVQEFELEVLRVQRACKGMEWLEKLLILETKNGQEVEDIEELGRNLDEDKEVIENKQPDVENVDRTLQKDRRSLQEVRFAIVGFHGSHFVVWDPVRQERLLSVQCGGGHRSWSLWTNKKGVWTGNGALAFIKQGAVLASERTLMEAKGKIGWTLREGIHGRGIGCVCRLGKISENELWEVVVTGGEDTSVTVLALNLKNGVVKVLAVLTDHISSVRAVTAAAVVEVKQDGGRESLSALVVSAGGRAQMQCCWLLIGWDERAAAPSCQVIQVAAHRLDEQWERKRNRHKMVKMDPETRYMSMAVLEETTDSLTLALACSDGAVRLFSVSEVNRHIDLLWESFHHQRCVLSVATCCLKDTQGNRRKLLFSAATDGQISVWDFTSFPSSNQISPSPTFTFPAHQSGVNSLAISPLKLNNFHLITVASGGDDGQLTVSKIRVQFIKNPGNSDLQNQLSVNLESQSSVPLAHAAPLTSLKLLNKNLIVSTSCDQRVCLWRVGSAGMSHQRAVCSHVADAAALAVWEEKCEQKCGSSAEDGEKSGDDEAAEAQIEESEVRKAVGGYVLVCGQGLQLLQVRDVLVSE